MPTNEESGFNQSILPRRAGQVFWGTSVTTLALLRAIGVEARRHLQIVFCLETQSLYYWDQNATSTESLPTVVTPTDGTGRWQQMALVSGATKVYKQATPPPIAEGDEWYDTENHVKRICNGTDWSTILGGI